MALLSSGLEVSNATVSFTLEIAGEMNSASIASLRVTIASNAAVPTAYVLLEIFAGSIIVSALVISPSAKEAPNILSRLDSTLAQGTAVASLAFNATVLKLFRPIGVEQLPDLDSTEDQAVGTAPGNLLLFGAVIAISVLTTLLTILALMLICNCLCGRSVTVERGRRLSMPRRKGNHNQGGSGQQMTPSVRLHSGQL